VPHRRNIFASVPATITSAPTTTSAQPIPKPGPKSGPKSGSKSGLKSGPKSGPKINEKKVTQITSPDYPLNREEQIHGKFVINGKFESLHSKLGIGGGKYTLECIFTDIYSNNKLMLMISPQLIEENAGCSVIKFQKLAWESRGNDQRIHIIVRVIY
jgi:hypothetical protein